MQLSKQEEKYRYKLFYENGYNKTIQQNLDYYVYDYRVTYKELYYKKSIPDACRIYTMKDSVKYLDKALRKLGIKSKDVTGNFKNTYDILNEISNK